MKQICVLALFLYAAVSAEKLPELTEYCQIEGVVVEKTGTTVFRMDRGHFSETISDVSLDDIDFGSLLGPSSSDDDDDSSDIFSSIIATTRRIYHADTKKLYTWAPANKSKCTKESYVRTTPVPRYVELYNSVNTGLGLYAKSTTEIGSVSFDLYTTITPSGATRTVIVNPNTGLPYTITEYKISIDNPSDSKIISSAMFTFTFPDTVDPKTFDVNETTECWETTVSAPTTYPSAGKCTVYVPPEDSSIPDAYMLPALPNYCTYSMNASGRYKASMMGSQMDNTLGFAVVTQDGNCWNKAETTTEGTTSTVQGIYHYGSKTYYTMTASDAGGYAGTCTKKGNSSVADANPVVSYYNTAREFFGKQFTLTEETFKGELVDVYTYGESVIRVSKTHGFPLYIKYSMSYNVIVADVSLEVLLDDIVVSMDESEPRNFDVPAVEGCREWSEAIATPVVTDPGDLDCKFFTLSTSSTDGSYSEGHILVPDGAYSVMPSLFAMLFILAFAFIL